MTRDNNPDRLDDGASAEAEMKEREAVAYGGWITWTGGECPLQRNTAGEIRVEAGEEFFDPDISDFNWRHDHKGPVPGRRIVAYRVALPAPQGDDTLVGRLEECASRLARNYNSRDRSSKTMLETAAALRSQAAEIAGLKENVRHLEIDCRQWSADYDERGNTLSAERQLRKAAEAKLASAMKALTGLAKLRKDIEADVATAHQTRTGASEWMREDDRDFRRDLATAFNDADALLSSIKGEAE